MANGNNLVQNVPIINAVSVSSTTTYTGSLEVSDDTNLAIQSVWTDTPTGTLTLNASLDNVNWSPIPGGSAITPAGSSGNNMQNFPNIGYKFVQASYTNASGSGTLTVTVCGKLVSN